VGDDGIGLLLLIADPFQELCAKRTGLYTRA
jgi:hypothetical protein